MLSLILRRLVFRNTEKPRVRNSKVAGAVLLNSFSTSDSSFLQNSNVDIISDECPYLAASLTKFSTTTGGPPALGCMYGITCNMRTMARQQLYSYTASL